jgi:hypothetical protein
MEPTRTLRHEAPRLVGRTLGSPSAAFAHERILAP